MAALGRPNLLLVPAAWAAVEAGHRRWMRVALLVAGVALAVMPTAVRNTVMSGHVVPISSNAGVTFYSGNAPGADVRGTQHPPGFKGGVAAQQSNATRIANLLAGEEMDPVEADQWWGRRALEARLDDPVGTLKLLVRRLSLLVSNLEVSLGTAPAMDANPFRWAAPFPLCLLIGLATGGVIVLGWRGTGGWQIWMGILVCAAMPVIFYVSSRYRLPSVALLCLPAGAGLTALAGGARDVAVRRKQLGLLFGVIAIVASLAIPVGELRTRGEVTALLETAAAWRKQGDLAEAEADLRRALDRHPESTRALVVLGELLWVDGREAEAEEAYRRALAIDPESADAAGGLGGVLVGVGQGPEAVPLLERYLSAYPLQPIGWKSLVLAHWISRDPDSARRAAEAASELGIRLDKRLLDLLASSRRPAK
jgi:Tfp pilus assembly protein PilF